MDIKDIMTDGKMDGGKIYQCIEESRYTCIYEDCDELAEVINAHIASLKQETPITPELLEQAGFVFSYHLYHEGYNLYDKSEVRFKVYKKTIVGFPDLLADSEEVSLQFDIKKEVANWLHIGNETFNSIKTMEELSTVYKCYTGEPLNWQHDPAAELRKRLVAMGFKSNAGNNYRLSLGDTDTADFIVEFDSSLNLSVWLGRMSRNKSGIKTIDALERVVKELKGE